MQGEKRTKRSGSGPSGRGRPLGLFIRPLDERLQEELDLLDREGLRLPNLERADLRKGAKRCFDRRILDDRHEVETLLLSELFLVVDVGEMAWNLEIEDKLAKQIESFIG